jgi:hypothetical protein
MMQTESKLFSKKLFSLNLLHSSSFVKLVSSVYETHTLLFSVHTGIVVGSSVISGSILIVSDTMGKMSVKFLGLDTSVIKANYFVTN